MANRCNDWQGMIKLANEDLKKYGAMLKLDNDEGAYSVEILYGVNPKDNTKFKESDCYAENYYEDELSELINEAWYHARAKAKAMLKPKKAKKAKAKKAKKYQVAVVLGEDAAECYDEYGLKELSKRISELGGNVVSHEFDTPAERNAYIMAMEDANGWWGNAVISNSDITKHPRMIKKML